MDWYWVMLVGGCIPFYVGVAWAYFGGWDGFVEAVRYALTPDIISLIRGEWEDDQWAQVMLLVFLVTCAGVTWGAHLLVQKVILGG